MRKVGSEKIVPVDFAASHLNLQLLNKVGKSEANSSLATYLRLAMVTLWHFGSLYLLVLSACYQLVSDLIRTPRFEVAQIRFKTTI